MKKSFISTVIILLVIVLFSCNEIQPEIIEPSQELSTNELLSLAENAYESFSEDEKQIASNGISFSYNMQGIVDVNFLDDLEYDKIEYSRQVVSGSNNHNWVKCGTTEFLGYKYQIYKCSNHYFELNGRVVRCRDQYWQKIGTAKSVGSINSLDSDLARLLKEFESKYKDVDLSDDEGYRTGFFIKEIEGEILAVVDPSDATFLPHSRAIPECSGVAFHIWLLIAESDNYKYYRCARCMDIYVRYKY